MRRFLAVPALLASVVLVAACGGGGGSSSYKAPKGPAVAHLTFKAKNFSFTPKKATSPAGVISITLTSTDGAHDLVIEGVPGFQLDVSGSGDSDTGKVELKKKKYTFYCTLPGHRAAGMEGTLTVG